MSSPTSERRPPPDLIHGVANTTTLPSKTHTFNFMPIGPAPASLTYIPPVRPVANNAGHFKIKSFQNGSQYTKLKQSNDILKEANGEGFPRLLAKRKTGADSTMDIGVDRTCEPQRKVHLNEEIVAQTMSNLYISHPRPKVARRNASGDVNEAMNLNSLEELEEKFSHQAAISNEDYTLPPPRSRKIPSRVKVPQLRLSIHEELKSLRSTNNILPEAIMARYRPSPRTGSTAVVLWKPPSSCIPDVISSALKSGPSGCSISNIISTAGIRPRVRCYSEVTSTPYSSHENLCCDTDMSDISSVSSQPCCNSSQHLPHQPSTHTCMSGSPTSSAEAPELSYSGEVEVNDKN